MNYFNTLLIIFVLHLYFSNSPPCFVCSQAAQEGRGLGRINVGREEESNVLVPVAHFPDPISTYYSFLYCTFLCNFFCYSFPHSDGYSHFIYQISLAGSSYETGSGCNTFFFSPCWNIPFLLQHGPKQPMLHKSWGGWSIPGDILTPCATSLSSILQHCGWLWFFPHFLQIY